MKILLLEDDPDIRGIISAILQRGGHEVVGVDGGDEALRAYCDQECSYDLVLTDVVHPGMDGVELAAKIRQLKLSQCIAFQTGRASDVAVLDRRKWYGVIDIPIIGKPFSTDQLLRFIESAVAGLSKGQ